jgi:translocation and assembly module TamB
MSDEEQRPLPESTIAPKTAANAAQRRRLHRHILRALAGTVLLASICFAALAFWISTDGFQRRLKQVLITQLSEATGGRVEMQSFHWNMWRLEVEIRGLTIHGLEPATDKPYAYLDHGVLDLRLIGLLWPRAGVRSLLLERPSFHLIVKEDGSTNQPTPKRHKKSSNSNAVDTIFDLEAGSVELRQGEVLVNDYSFPLDLSAKELHLTMAYQSALFQKDSYQLHLELANLTMQNGRHAAVKSRITSNIVLYRDAAQLQQLELVSSEKTLHIQGDLIHFAKPVWHLNADGEADLREVEAIIQEEGMRGGIATIHGRVEGHSATFLANADVKVKDAAYSREGAHIFGAALTAHLLMTDQDIDVDGIEVRLRDGGSARGEVKIHRWDIPKLGSIRLHPHDKPIVRTASVYGIADGVSLQQTMQIVGEGAYRDLGFRSNIYGTALVEWTRDATDLTVKADAELRAPAGGKGVPLEGFARGTYIDLPGRVDVDRIELRTPASEIHASGPLGVYPTNQRSAINVSVVTQDLNEFNTLLGLSEGLTDERAATAKSPIALHGTAQFNGKMIGSFDEPAVNGLLEAQDVTVPLASISPAVGKQTAFLHWDHVLFRGEAGVDRIHIDDGQLTEGASRLSVHGTLDALREPKKIPQFDQHSKLDATLELTNFDRQRLADIAGLPGNNSGKIQARVKAHGVVDQLDGSFSLTLPGGLLAGEPIHKATAEGGVSGTTILLRSLEVNQNGGSLKAAGTYDWRNQYYKGHANITQIDLEHLASLQSLKTKLTGRLTAEAYGEGRINQPQATLKAHLEGLSIDGSTLGSPDAVVTLNGEMLAYQVKSAFNAAQIEAVGTTQRDKDWTTHAKVDFTGFALQPLLNLDQAPGGEGSLTATGSIRMAGPLKRLREMNGDAVLQQLAVEARGVHLKNDGAIQARLQDGALRMQTAHITGEGTDLRIGGSIGLLGDMPLALDAGGSVNLKLLETADHDLSASGLMKFKLNATGSVRNPSLSGQVEFQNSSLALQDMPNGLSQMNGMLEFRDGRLVVKSLTALTGGGQLRFGGSLTYHGGLYADLTATGSNVRIRYPQGISSLADANFRLQGPQNNLLLSGNVLITRFSVNPDLDMASLAGAAVSNTTIASSSAPSNHIRLDVHISSAPQLSFQNSYAKLAGDVDLRVRGTVASPSILGKVSLTEGSGTFNGTKYQLQHGDIYFTNPVRVEPLIDLTATAQVQEYDISIVVHGTPDRMNVSYRSEPALSQVDVIGLLAMGRRQDEQRLNAQQQVTSVVNPSTDALLGSALNATLSNRVRKLFGTATVKIDPTVVGTMGNTTARVTVDQQVGKNVIITYAANVNTTAQQFIQAEIQLNRTISLVAVRDETGVASMVIRIKKRYR